MIILSMVRCITANKILKLALAMTKAMRVPTCITRQVLRFGKWVDATDHAAAGGNKDQRDE